MRIMDIKKFKYKGQAVDTGKWIYGYFSEVYVTGNTKITTEEGEEIQVKPETVEIFTGRKDKNGEEVYSGDCLEVQKRKGGRAYIVYIEYNENEAQFVTRSEGNIVLDNEPLGDINSSLCKIIGNLHDNSELTKWS